MATKKKDFIELDFTGKIKESGIIFDTTISEDAKKIGAEDAKSLKLCIGEGMVVKGFDEALEGKEIGKAYSIDIEPKKAFGPRDPSLIKIIPISNFHEKQINPYPGQILNIDNVLARISSVSGGRVITDFNLPLAGKTINYEFRIKKILESAEDKLKALGEFFLGNIKSVSLEGKKAILSIEGEIKNEKPFKEKAKSLLDIEVELKQTGK